MINAWVRNRQNGKLEKWKYPKFSYEFEYCQTLVKHSGCVNALAFTKNDKFLASGGDDLKVLLWVSDNTINLNTCFSEYVLEHNV